jgi:transposase
VQQLRTEYWDQIREIAPGNLVFVDESGILLGLMRPQARSPKGTRAYALSPFYRGSKVTVIGAISMDRVLAVMTLDGSMDSRAFEVFVQQCLVPQLWSGACVVMDNLSAHSFAVITPMIEAVGAKVVNLSPYSPEFNPIEHWWSQLKAFLRLFAPKSANLVDALIGIALDLVNPEHLRNWFAHCCYCDTPS